MPLILYILSLGAFVIGTTEFVIIGLVPTVAADLGVSVPATGMLITSYALSVAVFSPFVISVTNRFSRKPVLLFAMAVYVIGNLLAYLSPNYTTLLLARILSGLTHGLFFAVGTVIAMNLVAKNKANSAVSMVFAGFTVAMVLGVPLGIWIGQNFGWRITFLAVAILSLIALVGILFFTPNNLQHLKSFSIIEQLAGVIRPRLLLVFAITVTCTAGIFTLYTYIALILQDLAGFSSSSIAWILVFYGVAVAIGNIIGGRLADNLGQVKALMIIFAALAVIFFILSFAVNSKVTTIFCVFLWGGFAFSNVPVLQGYIIQVAGKYASKSVDIASGLNISAFNLGVALGSIIGSYVLTNFALNNLPWTGAVIMVFAIILTLTSAIINKV